MAKDYLAEIVARKQREIAARRRFLGPLDELLNPVPFDADRGERAYVRLKRNGATLPRVIAELKYRSPSAGPLRARTPGDGVRVVRGYEAGGAAAVSVLADGPGFGGSVLDVRRAAAVVTIPVLFKEFVLDEIQVRWARAVGASLVLLLVRTLDDRALVSLIDATWRAGLEPVVEAADADEVRRAVAAGARIVGVNARDLRTFAVDMAAAQAAAEGIPADRVAVLMSGMRSREDLVHAATGRADAVLVGEGFMRAEDPGAQLAGWLGAV